MSTRSEITASLSAALEKKIKKRRWYMCGIKIMLSPALSAENT